MTSTVRSVTVRLDAAVSKYISDMRRAGRETDKSFASAHSAVSTVNKDLGITHSRLGLVNTDLSLTNRRVLTLGQRLGPVSSELGKLNGNGTTGLPTLHRNVNRGGKEIDQFSGRIKVLLDLVALLGPGVVPLVTAATPALSGIAAGAGFAAVGLGTLLTSVQGVGDALKAVNKAALEPTEANLQAAADALRQLSPEARQFVRESRDMVPLLRTLRDAGAEEFFPGVIEGMDALEERAPDIERLISNTAETLGDLVAGDSKALAGRRWDDFFDFLARETSETLVDLNAIVGDITHGAAEMWMAFDGTNDDFIGWVRDAADGFDDWARSEQGRADIAEFLAYVRENGPQVADTVGAIGGMFLEVAEAAAPLGGPVLAGLEAVADVVSAIADSDLGTPIFVGLAALSAYTRGAALLQGVQKSTFGQIATGQKDVTAGWTKASSTVKTLGSDINSVARFGTLATESSSRLRGQLANVARTAGPIAGLALATSGVADSTGLAHSASLGLMGTLAGPWGAAVGAGVGLVMDFAAANDELTDSISQTQFAIESADPYTANLAQLQAELDTRRFELQQFKDEVAGTNRYTSSLSVAGIKNRFEGYFGNSDVEELESDVERAESAYAELAAAQERAAAQTGLYRLYKLETEALEENIAAMRAKRSEALRGLNAELDYKGAILDARDALKDNGKTVNENTRKGQDNLRALYGLADAWNSQSDAVKNAQGGLRTARRNFVETAVAMGMAEGKAKDLAREIFEIPTNRRTKIDFESDLAMQRVKAIKSELASIDRNIDVYVNIRKPNAGGYGAQIESAKGNFLPGGRTYAYGGMDLANRHQPEFAGPGPARVWREQETGGESYIPHANDSRRARAKAILEQTAHLFNGDVIWGSKATLGRWGGDASSVGGRTVVVERIIERLPSQVVLRTDDGAFRAYVVGHASSVAGHRVDAERDFDDLVNGR